MVINRIYDWPSHNWYYDTIAQVNTVPIHQNHHIDCNLLVGEEEPKKLITQMFTPTLNL